MPVGQPHWTDRPGPTGDNGPTGPTTGHAAGVSVPVGPVGLGVFGGRPITSCRRRAHGSPRIAAHAALICRAPWRGVHTPHSAASKRMTAERRFSVSGARAAPAAMKRSLARYGLRAVRSLCDCHVISTTEIPKDAREDCHDNKEADQAMRAVRWHITNAPKFFMPFWPRPRRQPGEVAETRAATAVAKTHSFASLGQVRQFSCDGRVSGNMELMVQART